MANPTKSDERKIMRSMHRHYCGSSQSIRLGIELEKMRVKLGSAAKLVRWLDDHHLPSGAARELYGVKETRHIDEHIN